MEYGPFSAPSDYTPESEHLRSDNLATSASLDSLVSEYPELARVNASRHAQGNIHGNTITCWRALVREQPTRTRLSFTTYQELSALSRLAMPDIETYQATDVLNAIHDDLKNVNLLSQVGLTTDGNHDDALQRLFLPECQAVRQEHFPSLAALKERYFSLIQNAARGNFIRFVQSQASESEVRALVGLPRDAQLVSVMHGIHDLAGAQSTKDETTSLTLDEPAATRLLDAAYALLLTPEELGLPDNTEITSHMHQLTYMRLRAHRLGIAVHTLEDQQELPSKLVVADLLRCYNARQFAPIQSAFHKLPFVLRSAWAMVQALPIQYPESSERLAGMGTEYAPAFLRAFGKDEMALYKALGCFAQIQLHAQYLPVAMTAGQNVAWPARAPYQKINYYHLAQAFREAPPSLEMPLAMTYTISDDMLVPRLSVDAGSRTDNGYRAYLLHPDTYKAPEIQQQ